MSDNITNILYEVKNLVIENKRLLGLIKSYCVDETSCTDEISNILVGLDMVINKQEKTLVLLNEHLDVQNIKR